MLLAHTRALFLIAVVLGLIMLGGALCVEYLAGVEPCPLCILQRLAVMAITLVCMAGALHGPSRSGRRLYAGLALLGALGGVATAIWQLYLQELPVEYIPECLPRLEVMIDALPFQPLIAPLLHGTADCAEVSWSLLGMSLPEWNLLGFLSLGALMLAQGLRRR